MIPSRVASRAAARSIRASARTNGRQIRFATTNQQAAAAGGSSGLVGGLAGGGLVFLVSTINFPGFLNLTITRLDILTTTSLARNPSSTLLPPPRANLML